MKLLFIWRFRGYIYSHPLLTMSVRLSKVGGFLRFPSRFLKNLDWSTKHYLKNLWTMNRRLLVDCEFLKMYLNTVVSGSTSNEWK